MTKDIDAFGGFDVLVDMITNAGKDPIAKRNTVEEDEESTTLKLSKSVDDEEEVEEVEENEESEVENEIDEEDEDDKSDDGDKKKPGQPEKKKRVSNDDEETDDNNVEDPAKADAEDLGEVEPEISLYFATSIADKLGLDLDKESKFEKLDDVIDLMTDVIKVNSKPSFASEEVEEYDKYIRNGGKDLKSFYDEVYKDSINIEKVDLETEKDQKAVIAANLKLLGYKQERIDKVIARYEDAEVLKEEAEDALEILKDNESKKAKTLLAEQEKAKLATEKQNKEFFDNVVKYVDNLKDIRGVDVDSKTKKEIVDYIFRVQADGSTQFQKAYASDVIKNLIESAYFTKYGDILLNKTSKKATDAALSKVRNKLKASKGKRNTGSGSGLGKASPNFSALSGLIIR